MRIIKFEIVEWELEGPPPGGGLPLVKFKGRVEDIIEFFSQIWGIDPEKVDGELFG